MDHQDSNPPATYVNWQITVIAVILIVAVVTVLGPILKPLLSAVFVYFLIRPAAHWMKRHGYSASWAYLILFLIASGAVTALLSILSVNAVRFQRDWPMYKQQFLDAATRWGLHDRLSEGMNLLTPETVISFVASTAAESAEFGFMLVFYLLLLTLSAPKFPKRVHRAFPPEQAERILAVFAAVTDGMAKYMEVKTAVNAGLALTVGIVLAAFGIDYWLLWTALIFAMNYVTYIGAVAALIPPILLGFLQLPLAAAITLFVLLMAIRFIWIDLLEVQISGRHLNLDSLLLLVFMAYWGWAWGLIGLVLAMPIATCLRAAFAAVEATHPVAALMSGD